MARGPVTEAAYHTGRLWCNLWQAASRLAPWSPLWYDGCMEDARNPQDPSGTLYSVLGPPGTGKTRYLERQIDRVTEEYGAEAIIAASFTRAAARTLTRRLTLGPEQVGTLHAMCYRWLGRPRIVETPEGLAEWNEANPSEARRLGGAAVDRDLDGTLDVPTQRSEGDRLHQEMTVNRAKMIPRDRWGAATRSFADDWDVFKQQTEMVDFTDLIEIALKDGVAPPHGVRVGFFDEVQDFTRLEVALVHAWAAQLDHAVLAGDDDQCIYSFKGADPLALTDRIDPQHTRTLKQSHRLPRAVHQYADRWIAQLAQRAAKPYEPRDEEGELKRDPALTPRTPNALDKHLDSDGTTMILTSTSYHLSRIVAHLRRQGIPYHNPYRTNRPDWNPLAVPAKGTSTIDRFRAYHYPAAQGDLWTHTQLAAWIDLINANTALTTGAKQQIKAAADSPAAFDKPDIEQVLAWFGPEHLTAALTGDPGWLLEHAVSKHRKGLLPYLIALYRTGINVNATVQPRVIVGTIHSVKGGEADTVVLMPDLSPQGYRSYLTRGELRDSVIRTFYVGITRARRCLVLGGSAGPGVAWLS